MVEIKYVKSTHKYIFELKGHAEYNPGNDIVCSAVSALAYTLLGSLENIDYGIFKTITMGNGYIKCETIIDYDDIKTKIDAIHETILIGYLQIQEKYKNHVIVDSSVV